MDYEIDDERPPDERPKRGGKIEAPPPNMVAETVLGERDFLTDDVDAVYEYREGCWHELSESALRALALAADGRFWSSARRRGEIVSFMKAATHRPGLKWGRVADTEVACSNGVADVATGELRPHRQEDYLERVLPWPYSPGAPCPNWLAALDDWFGIESDEVSALQEFFGYVILSHAKFKKALLLKGGGDTGKSVVLFVLTRLVGENAVCSLPVEHMDDPQKRAVIRGKLLNVMSEISAEALVADGGFKQLVSTEEPILLDEKYKKAEMYIPRTKHVIATNTLPRLNDRTEATLNRLLIIPMLRVVPKERQDETLKDRLVAEMQGILWWALDGARRLTDARGQFSEVPAAAAMLAELRSDANPVRIWLRERCVLDLERATPLAVLTDDYNKWNRGSRKITSRQFGKMARDAGQTIKNIRNGKAVATCVSGLVLLEPDTATEYRITVADATSSADEIVASTHYEPPPERPPVR